MKTKLNNIVPLWGESPGDRWILLNDAENNHVMDDATGGYEAQFGFNFHISQDTLKRKCRHFDEMFITGRTEIYQNDNLQCSQWWKFRQNDDFSVSV